MASMLYTLAADAHHSLDIKHSRFLAHAAALDDPAHTRETVQRVSVPGATHDCRSSRFGQDDRASDDGEYSGTACRPILAAADGQGDDRVVVVDTRWDGGIKLSVGGVVRAYAGTAAEWLRLATLQPLIALSLTELQCRFDDLSLVHAALAAFHADKLGEHFDATAAALQVQLPADQLAGFKTRLCDATGNRVHISTPEAA
ncbi:IMPACT family protein [Xanthomonas fragariae]|uniref:IMPACT family protein n=1 Tax=Xanthomonas fragariae TaxID=48664 RepID=UPI000D5602B8|nr:YigZ family protein [Xanthomonas fragariae]